MKVVKQANKPNMFNLENLTLARVIDIMLALEHVGSKGLLTVSGQQLLQAIEGRKYKLKIGNSETEKESGPKITYYLFGSDAVRVFHNEGFEQLLKEADGHHGSAGLLAWDESHPSHELLEAYDGWMDWVILTKEQHEQLNEFI